MGQEKNQNGQYVSRFSVGFQLVIVDVQFFGVLVSVRALKVQTSLSQVILFPNLIENRYFRFLWIFQFWKKNLKSFKKFVIRAYKKIWDLQKNVSKNLRNLRFARKKFEIWKGENWHNFGKMKIAEKFKKRVCAKVKKKTKFHKQKRNGALPI